MQTKKTNVERRKEYYAKIWGLDEKNSYREPRRFIKQLAPEHYHAPEFVKLNNWNWKKNFNSLEEATEFLLNYCTELGPLARECIDRLNKNSELIKELTYQNKSLKTQMKGVYSNDTRRRKNEEKGAI